MGLGFDGVDINVGLGVDINVGLGVDINVGLGFVGVDINGTSDGVNDGDNVGEALTIT